MSKLAVAGKAPKYEELAVELRRRIADGLYAQSGFLPRERVLSEEFQVSRNTLRNALKILADEGLITAVQGRGTAVNQTPVISLEFVAVDCRKYLYSASSFVLGLLHEIDRQAARNNGFMTYMGLESDSEKDIAVLREKLSAKKNIGGLILLGSFTRNMLRQMRHFPHPTVMIGDVFLEPLRNDELFVSQVVGDDYGMAYQSTERLLDEGACEIVLCGPPRSIIWGNSSFNGFQDAYLDRAFPFKPENYLELLDGTTCSTEEFLHFASETLEVRFRNSPRPDGLILPVHCFAAVKHIFDRYHLKIPRDLKVIGRSSKAGRYSFPNLTYSPEAMVREAFNLLQSERESGSRTRQRRIVGPVWQEGEVTH